MDVPICSICWLAIRHQQQLKLKLPFQFKHPFTLMPSTPYIVDDDDDEAIKLWPENIFLTKAKQRALLRVVQSCRNFFSVLVIRNPSIHLRHRHPTPEPRAHSAQYMYKHKGTPLARLADKSSPSSYTSLTLSQIVR